MTARTKPKTEYQHPGLKCPCAECGGERCRRERLAQGLPEQIEDPAFYEMFARMLLAAPPKRMAS